ncbi:MAG: Sjogren's syndrome/scleroderma autoantigen 1 family protein [Haloarculaceae archaeon]
MSDFDKEAEREKLREKFERDEQKREATRQMSELLLKGATMTNRHCDNCGDPIFRYEGEEFCPSCGGAAAQQAADVPQNETEVDTPRHSLDVEPPADEGATGDGSRGEPATPPADQAGTPEQSAPTQQSAQSTPDRQTTRRAASEGASQGDAPVAAGAGRKALERALTSAARNAEAAEDPRTAAEWLKAAREAAEAMATLDGR